MRPSVETLLEVVEWEPALLDRIVDRLVSESSFDALSALLERILSQPDRRKRLKPLSVAAAQAIPRIFNSPGVSIEESATGLLGSYSMFYVDKVIPLLKSVGTKRNIASTAMSLFANLQRPLAYTCHLAALGNPSMLQRLEALSRLIAKMMDCLDSRNVRTTSVAYQAVALAEHYDHLAGYLNGALPPTPAKALLLLLMYTFQAGTSSAIKRLSSLTNVPSSVLEECALNLLENKPQKRQRRNIVFALRTLANILGTPGHIRVAIELALANT